MDIREAHDQLNSKEGESYRYQLMTATEIEDLFLSCDCPVAIGLGVKVVLTKGKIDPARGQESVVFQCVYAVEGETNVVYTETQCKILKMRKCKSHYPHGDSEPGLGVFVQPNP